MIRPRRLVLVLLAAATSAVAVTLSAQTLPAPATRPAPAFPALSYYDTNCARCHGPDGSFYGPTLGNDLTDAGLTKIVRDMAKGPGNAPLHESELAVETAYHRALILHTPFLAVTEMGATHWAGEASPSSKVTLAIGTTTIHATLDEYTWTADLPPNTNPRDVTITAEANGKTTTLKPTESTYSAKTPLLPAKDRK